MNMINWTTLVIIITSKLPSEQNKNSLELYRFLKKLEPIIVKSRKIDCVRPLIYSGRDFRWRTDEFDACLF